MGTFYTLISITYRLESHCYLNSVDVSIEWEDKTTVSVQNGTCIHMISEGGKIVLSLLLGAFGSSE